MMRRAKPLSTSLTAKQKADILCHNAARFLRLAAPVCAS